MAKLILIFLGVCYAIMSQNPLHVSVLINISLLLIIFMNRHNVNIVHVCAGLLVVYFIEMLIFENLIVTKSAAISQVWVNAIIYTAHFVLDLMLFLLLTYRASFTRARLRAQGKPHAHVFTYNSEFALTSLFVVFMLVDLLALGENFIRHLDEFGLSAETVQRFANWTMVFYSYVPVKSVLLGITFLLIWTMTTSIGQEKYHKVAVS
ncbi:hypothetical protein SG34_027865 [Thalassomonas viridans]|uniref:Uncharacterized protein n=1 Tax=Thalassomonas viridans TaxID=137584 RepID=A0AAE9Z1X8_9GAMM|nr:hypothetical protein [Thalassomonas viridans]WDE05073.1 hypothetical protein SG34_027865 [Thalassomonas viridans]